MAQKRTDRGSASVIGHGNILHNLFVFLDFLNEYDIIMIWTLGQYYTECHHQHLLSPGGNPISVRTYQIWIVSQ